MLHVRTNFLKNT